MPFWLWPTGSWVTSSEPGFGESGADPTAAGAKILY